MKTKEKINVKYSFSPIQIIIIGFLIAILIGGILLSLPIFNNKDIEPLDAFFIATSAICVTGHTTVDVASQFNIYGQTLIMILIQIGGLRLYNYNMCITGGVTQKVNFKAERFNWTIFKL